MTLFTRQTARGRCPCGSEHATCGPPSTVTPFGQDIEEVAAMRGPLRKYRYVSAGGSESVLKLSAEDAERHGLSDEDLIESGSSAKAASPDPNKARPAAANKARAPRGKGGAGGGD
ncbi:hypothetical protein ADK52_25605 [Streptomyces sp. WM6372]|uniref:hypothetical protein n=1 Tax=Streptomyces sp. WM6372 TaxID=1415555 RepID=UPI0006ADA2B0|nr:hypothetical protein [Streptomyces sp. WM6372]KOU20964.1 hypothetical protein ADK52_25605 [Streptomyces sp. WM6372]